MTTVVNNPTPERVTTIEKTDTGGWAVAVVILLLVIAGGAYWYYHRAPAPAASGGTNINVTLPAGGNSNTAPAN